MKENKEVKQIVTLSPINVAMVGAIIQELNKRIKPIRKVYYVEGTEINTAIKTLVTEGNKEIKEVLDKYLIKAYNLIDNKS